MPKTDIVYGKSYKPCPCAQVRERATTQNTYFTTVCHSPMRGGKSQKILEAEQVRICMGGTSHGQRYTACPYYVKNAKINAPAVTKSVSLKKVLLHILSFFLCFSVAKACFTSGDKNALLSGVVFGALAVLSIVSLFKKSSKIDTTQSRGKGKRR